MERPKVTGTSSNKLFILPAFLLQAVFFWFVSQHRLIDADEGFYVLAARLVVQHKVPYIDFFYTPAPLLPYAYAAWLKLTGTSWFAARAFSGLLCAMPPVNRRRGGCGTTRR